VADVAIALDVRRQPRERDQPAVRAELRFGGRRQARDVIWSQGARHRTSIKRRARATA
jgi:hypothetical protein